MRDVLGDKLGDLLSSPFGVRAEERLVHGPLTDLGLRLLGSVFWRRLDVRMAV